MGVCTPLDILEAVHRGVDMFDCIMPTQLAQRGAVFTSRGFLQMRRGVYKFSNEKLDPACSCPTCARYSRAYLHHLTKTSETLGWQLLGKHNIHFYHQLMRDIRASILADRFGDFYRAQRVRLQESDRENPALRPKPARQKSRSLGNYEVHIAHEGFASIRQISSGEIMHMRTPPMEEARSLYIEQSNLARRIRRSDANGQESLVIWDVGLGAAANAMPRSNATSAGQHPTSLSHACPYQLRERSRLLRLALRHDDKFLISATVAPSASRGIWRGSRKHVGLSWELVAGISETVGQAPFPPDPIFYDMFSSKTHGEQWMIEIFAACSTPVPNARPSFHLHTLNCRARHCSPPGSMSPRAARPASKRKPRLH
jgi:queuine tRNA-ribosyltransferase